jgi:anti-anti-sigma factor
MASGGVMSIEQADVRVPVNSDGQPALSLSLTSQGDTAVIAVAGEIDIDTAHLLTEIVDPVSADLSCVVIDMANVTFFSAAGLNALLRARQTVNGLGGRLVLRAPSRATQRILTVTNTDRAFEIEYTATSACEPVP